MSTTLLHSIWTVLMFVLFIGIVAWAFSRKRKKNFDEAARLPLEDDAVQGRTNVAGGRMPGATDADLISRGD
jgi:cytochrome c oxidase cbb3-type subunit 4